MSQVNTINLVGLDHAAREQKIFPTLAQLDVGGIFRIITEFNPVPLVFLLKAGSEFEVVYEQEGPQEWILNVKRVAPAEDKRAAFRSMLEELHRGNVSAESKEKARALFQTVDAKTLGEIEQELILEGVSHEEIRHSLCDIHLEVMKESLVANQIEVLPGHPVHTLMEEHKVIVSQLNELGELVQRLKSRQNFDQIGADLERLKHVAHHLVEAENHHLREEEVLFPMLEKHGVVEPPSIMRLDHVEFRQRKHELHRVAQLGSKQDFNDFKLQVIDLGEYLARELGSHIFKEDNILYQIALQVLAPQEWEEIRVGCDKIGYCCFTPKLQPQNGKFVELDLRPLPPYQRHDKIMAVWQGLQPGEALLLINDHDPKPLRYQFEAEYAGQHTWQYEQSGPRDWAVKITKTQSG